jgi:hypothetical protein
LVGQVDFIPGQVNFAWPLALGQVLEKIICQPLISKIYPHIQWIMMEIILNE